MSMEQTKAALRNFGYGPAGDGQLPQYRTPSEFIQALGEVKEAALRALQETEHPWPDSVFERVLQVLADIRSGRLDHRFPLDLAQGGAGTSLHMNICEVLADEVAQRLGRPDLFHFLDDGARSQSTNDVVSTAAIIVIQRRIRSLESAVIALQEALVEREQAWRGITIMGRTEWQDALPMDLSQVASAWAGSAERDRWRLGKLKERARTIPLGGTATGIGLGASAAYLFAAEQQLRRLTGLPLQRSQNLTDAVAQRDDFSEVANGFALIGANIVKLCRDLMFYTSTVVGELEHPALQWGSTAMPVKTNPVLLEFAMGLAIRAQHRAASIPNYAQEGFLQLNAFTPFMVDAFIGSASDLERALNTLARDLLPALRVRPERCIQNMLQSRALLNLLRKDLPYETLKALAADWQSGAGATTADRDAKVHQYIDELSRLTGLDREVIKARFSFLLTSPSSSAAEPATTAEPNIAANSTPATDSTSVAEPATATDSTPAAEPATAAEPTQPEGQQQGSSSSLPDSKERL